ncbi:MAG: aminotransferase class IV [Desulfobacterota bacterium]|jgi:branched-chain amino acid aminotransferase|nr:aminotransferase class IV [Thermodesulfobacteriota bacterium]
MLENRIVYLNGEFVAWNDAKVHLMCHSVGRGSAIFEVLSLHDTSLGTAVFRLDEHMDRLFRSAELLDMELPGTKASIHEAVLESVRRNGVRQGFIKIICFYSQIAFEILPPQKKLDLSIFVVDPKEDLGGLQFPVERGVSACISKWRKLDPETVPVEAKAAANYLNGMMARGEAKKRGFDNAVMLDTQGFIAEGGTESVLLVKGGVLMAAGLGTVLASISRKSLLQAAQSTGIPTFEGRLRPELFYEAEEILFSGTPMKALPIRQIENRILEKVPGPVAQKLMTLTNDIVAGKDDRFRSWLFPVGK